MCEMVLKYKMGFARGRELRMKCLLPYILVYSNQTHLRANATCVFRPIGRMEEGMTSSRYGLYKLGYTFATMKISEIGFLVHLPQKKCLLSTDRFLQFETREDGIASNRKSDKLR